MLTTDTRKHLPDFEKDLIAVLLVVESVHDKNKLLFKYEQTSDDKPSDPPSNFHSDYAVVIAQDFDPASVKDANAPRTTFRSFDKTTISILTCPNIYDNHVEVQVDDVVFVGHTLGLQDNTNLKSFAIFFVLNAIAKAAIILSYQELSKRIGTAIRCEEQRTSYLTQEYHKLIGVLQQHSIETDDRLFRLPSEDVKVKEREEKDRTMANVYGNMIDQSVLAATLKQVYIDLQITGEINVMINNWLRVSCCLPHRSIPMSCSLSIDFAFNVLSNAEKYFKPYYGLLLIIDPSALLASLPIDSSSTLNTLVRHIRSSYSMSRLSMETGVPLSQIYSLAAHLLYWGRAKIIYPIHDDNIYVISPDADLSKRGSLSKLYMETFQNTSNYPTLQEALAEYSDAVTFYDHISRKETESESRDNLLCVEWLLRHRLLVQLHYFYFIILPNDERYNFGDEYKRTRLPRPRVPLERNQSERRNQPWDNWEQCMKSDRLCLSSENFDTRESRSNRIVSEQILATSPATNTMSSLSTLNSKSADVQRILMGTSHDDVFVANSLGSSSLITNIQRPSFHHYFNRIDMILQDESYEYRQRLALAIQDKKEQDVVDFLKIIKYLDGTHHLEEIASMENMSRSHILTTLEKFQTIVVRALHPDPNPVLQI